MQNIILPEYIAYFLTWLFLGMFFIYIGITLITVIKDSAVTLLCANIPLLVSTSYFTGLSFIILVFRASDYILENVKSSLQITAAITAAILLMNYKKSLVVVFSSRNWIFIYFLATFLISILLLFYWLPPTTTPYDVNALIGSLHTGRYVNLANYINKCGYIPVIGQNSGLSIALAFIQSISPVSPYAIIFILQTSSVMALSIFAYGIFMGISQSAPKSAIGALTFMLGSSFLSLAYVVVIDSGSPFLLNGSTDAILGIFLIIAIVVLIFFYQKNKQTIATLPLLGLFIGMSFFSAPQHIVFICILFLLLVAQFIFDERLPKVVIQKLAKIIFLTLIISAILVPMGGMLTPKLVRESINLVGMMSVDAGGGGIKFNPNFTIFIPSKNFVIAYEPLLSAEPLFGWQSSLEISMRTIVLPIFGMWLLIFAYKKRALRTLKASTMRFCIITILAALLTSLIFTYLIDINGYKWELARFSIPIFAFGMLAFSLGLIALLSFRKYIIACTFLIVLALFGPVSFMLSSSISNYINFSPVTMDTFIHYKGSFIYDSQCGKTSDIYKIRERYLENILRLSLVPISNSEANNYTRNIASNLNAKKTVSLSFLLSTSGQINMGTIYIDFVKKNGDVIRIPMNLSELNDNQYNEIKLPVDSYEGLTFHSSDAKNIKFWTKNNAICAEIKFSDGTRQITSGCPENLADSKYKKFF